MSNTFLCPSSDLIDDLVVAREVIQKEIESLKKLSQTLDSSFVDAVEIIAKRSTGRVIVSGMGKSGHVGSKIAATLASTGTPAFFVHPAEASHGDLGMITKEDCVLALSNSGKTRELLDIVEYARRSTIPLIALTQNPQSDLAKTATVCLLMPSVSEACPNGLAPTTSTIMMMAVGDALAVSLLVRRGFSAHDFRRFHPGGELGKKLLRVEDLMHQGNQVPLVPFGTRMDRALLVMTEKKFGCVGVVDDVGRLKGIITDGDLRRHMNEHFFHQCVDEIITPNVQTILPHSLAVEALARMQEKEITALFVADEALIPKGILNIHDCLKAGLI